MNPTVAVTHLSKSFGRVQAVKDVSFEVMPGEIFGLLGPNGAGKTTGIRMMLDIFKPDSGEVRIFGGKMRAGTLPGPQAGADPALSRDTEGAWGGRCP